jgi:hypothetical protein
MDPAEVKAEGSKTQPTEELESSGQQNDVHIEAEEVCELSLLQIPPY